MTYWGGVPTTKGVNVMGYYRYGYGPRFRGYPPYRYGYPGYRGYGFGPAFAGGFAGGFLGGFTGAAVAPLLFY